MNQHIHYGSPRQRRERIFEEIIMSYTIKCLVKYVDVNIQNLNPNHLGWNQRPHQDTLSSNCQRKNTKRISKLARGKQLIIYKESSIILMIIKQLFSWRMYSQTCLLPVAVQRQQIENCMVPEPHPCTPTVHTRLLLRWSSPLPSHTYSHIGEKQSQLKTPGALIPLL